MRRVYAGRELNGLVQEAICYGINYGSIALCITSNSHRSKTWYYLRTIYKEDSMDTSTDNPRVIVRPPLLYAAALVLVLVLRWFWPMPILGRAIPLWPGLVLFALGAAVLISGRRAMKAQGTNINLVILSIWA
jgi:hypothetical protein